MTTAEPFRTSGFLPHLSLGHFQFPMYFLIISVVISGCIYWTVRRAERFFFPRKHLIDLVLVGLISGLAGARLAHVFIENPTYYWAKPIEIINLLEGGFVWLGGLLGAALGSLCFLRWRGLPALRWFDFVSPSMAFGYGLGRIACWLTGCCFGRVCHLGHYAFEFPTQLLAIFWELGVGFFLLSLSKRRRILGTGRILATWILLHSLGRILMELMRDDLRGPVYFFVGISGWFAFFSLLAAGFWLTRAPRTA